MKTFTFEIPATLMEMTSAELERAVISSINKPLTVKQLVPTFEERYPTRRAANSIAKRVSTEDLTILHTVLIDAKERIDFNRQYMIVTQPHSRIVTIRQ